jgi:hypothetical protein
MKRFAAKSRDDYEAAKRYFSYDPLTGHFKYLVRLSSNTKVGDIAGSNKGGYIEITYNNIRVRAHRLAWFFYYNEVPDTEIDHEDTIKNHNWISNLRKASRNNNMTNKNKQKNNTSGYKGVSWHSAGNRWSAQIQFKKKVYHLGLFKCPIEAHKAYQNAAKKLHEGYENFGFK